MKKIEELRTAIENEPEKSAWDKGVKLYALELLDGVAERARYEGREPENTAELKIWALNGAQDWSEYSCGGCSLIYNSDIAERLCCPSELKKVRGGERKPNAKEEWLDVQARALFQAFNHVSRLCSDLKRVEALKTYHIYLSDAPIDPIKGQWKNKTDARKAARIYIKQWGLHAAILEIREV